MATGTIKTHGLKSATISTTTDMGGYFVLARISSKKVIVSLHLENLLISNIGISPSEDLIYGMAMTRDSSQQIVAYNNKPISGIYYYYEG